MATKTVAKKMLKWLPLSVDILEKLDNDDKSFKYLENTGETQVKEVEKEDFELLEANQETGEIKENSINNELQKEEEEYNPFPNN